VNHTPALALAVAALLLAGCGSTGGPSPDVTASGAPDDRSVAHVKLVVMANVATTVHLSDGDRTTSVEMAPDSDGFATKEFDAPLPWVVAGTVVAVSSGQPAAVGCELYVDRMLVASSDSSGGADSSRGGDEPTLAVCAATQELPWPTGEGEEAASMVHLRSTSSSDAWNGWVINDWVVHETSDTEAVMGNWLGGPARFVVVPLRTTDTSTCTIEVSDTEKATATTSGPGDIATCSAVRKKK
jgi:hypothetical protein